MRVFIEKLIDDHVAVVNRIDQSLFVKIEDSVTIILNCLRVGGKIFLFGNGGSAGDAQHIAAEFVGRFVKERKGLPAIALTTDTSAITAIANDYGYRDIFSRQLEALVNPHDVIIAISTSGNSENVIKGVEYAKSIGCRVIIFTGHKGGKLAEISDVNLNVPSNTTARIQEMHILIGHIICELVDEYL